MRELISVIIPAYNAADSIDRTLRSVRAQSWREMEIIVVDDGSSDATAERVRRHADEDERIRLIQIANGGVARARNRGIDEARGEWIAPIDADDLWHPRKLAAQMEAAELGGDRVGLVYCWYAVIDGDDRIIRLSHPAYDAGYVLRRMCMGNLVGNGSSALMRRSAVTEAGGYDPCLRDEGAQGCEDLKLYFWIAERYEFAVVPEYLTGYRWTPENMSSDARRMLRSYDIVMRPMYERHQQHHDALLQGRTYYLLWLIERSVRSGDLRTARELWLELARMRPYVAATILHRVAKWLVWDRWLNIQPAGAGTFGQDAASP